MDNPQEPFCYLRGAARTRTGDKGFAGRLHPYAQAHVGALRPRNAAFLDDEVGPELVYVCLGSGTITAQGLTDLPAGEVGPREHRRAALGREITFSYSRSFCSPFPSISASPMTMRPPQHPSATMPPIIHGLPLIKSSLTLAHSIKPVATSSHPAVFLLIRVPPSSSAQATAFRPSAPTPASVEAEDNQSPAPSIHPGIIGLSGACAAIVPRLCRDASMDVRRRKRNRYQEGKPEAARASPAGGHSRT